MNPIPEDTFTLLERHTAGDPDALGVLVSRYYPNVVRIVGVRVRSQTNCRVDVADLVQQTMERAIRNLDQFQRQEDAKWIHWLSRIAERVVLSNYRDQTAARRDARRESGKVGQGVTTWGTPRVDPVDKGDSPSVLASRKEDHELVDKCLSTLEPDQREIILLRNYADASWEMIAEEMQRPSADAARKFYYRSRDILKQRLEGMMGEDL